ncbi:Dabb family protein [Aquimarina rhabdastrellae]
MEEEFKKIGEQQKLISHQIGSKDESGFSHNAFIWLGDNASEAERKQFFEDFKKLAELPEVYKVSFGFPKEGLPKEEQFDVVWLCHFKSKTDYHTYTQHPIHKRFVDDYLPRFKKVLVFDKYEKTGKVSSYQL